ncbi:cytochrome P450 [Didymella exigua CBS 183.55]|uniref:Cytochrome P450 n=1 Tax=Didymella exigua CBS 183.55 TaxID=1150837 RepID=A0A6A5RLU5_9PLEO|nr:cytochrome P450 [Didymella exigua CBS 183.55]KAF1928230.1 cytochrome P450 [Didymella exigua CBS 183.55]
MGLCGLAAALAVLFINAFRFKVDSREPPVIYPRIPLIGHIIGILTKGALYNKTLSQNLKLPIFTLPVLTGRTYIVADPALCASIQKASSTMSFDPLIAEVTPRLIGSNAHTASIIRGPPGRKLDRASFVTKSHPVINTPLMANNIHDVSKKQLDYFSGLVSKVNDGSEFELFHFIRTAVTAASQSSFYGPNNPFAKNPHLVEDFWDWEAGNVAYMTGVFSSLFAREAVRGMKACVKGFKEWIETEGYKDAYVLLRNRNQLHTDEGIVNTEEKAKLEVAFSLGINVNASGVTFWMVNQIFSRPELLSKIREEIRANAIVDHGVLSVERLRLSCPRLNSVARETMRLYAPAISARLVTEDTLVADTWLLRKGAVVQLNGSVIHNDPDIWGLDCESFNPDRFLYSLSGSKTNPDGTVPEGRAHFIHPAAFRSFGGGTSWCPGRHFAQMEVLGLAAVLVMGFDLEPVNGAQWNPPADVKRIPISVMKPMAPLDVRVNVRREYQGVTWEMKP